MHVHHDVEGSRGHLNIKHLNFGGGLYCRYCFDLFISLLFEEFQGSLKKYVKRYCTFMDYIRL